MKISGIDGGIASVQVCALGNRPYFQSSGPPLLLVKQTRAPISFAGTWGFKLMCTCQQLTVAYASWQICRNIRFYKVWPMHVSGN